MGILSCDASIAGLELNIMRQPAKAHSHQDLSLITIPFGETKQTLKSTPSLTVANLLHAVQTGGKRKIRAVQSAVRTRCPEGS